MPHMAYSVYYFSGFAYLPRHDTAHYNLDYNFNYNLNYNAPAIPLPTLHTLYKSQTQPRTLCTKYTKHGEEWEPLR